MSVHGPDIQCFVLRDEVDELDNRRSGFWRSLVWWLWTVKTPIKMLAMMRKTEQIEPDLNFFMTDENFRGSVQCPLMTRQRDVVVVRTALTAAMVVPYTMFKVYDPPYSETLVSKLFQNFPVINMTWEAVHIKFLIRKLVFTIIPIANEGSIILISHLFRMDSMNIGMHGQFRNQLFSGQNVNLFILPRFNDFQAVCAYWLFNNELTSCPGGTNCFLFGFKSPGWWELYVYFLWLS